MKSTLRERFEQKYLPEPNSGCWLWVGAVDKTTGYGKIGAADWRNGAVNAHQASYEIFVGPVPPGLVLDHKCRVRCCVNPHHLEPVTNAENIRRGIARFFNANKTNCPKGHPYDAQNTTVYVSKRGTRHRHCRTCNNELTRARRNGGQ